MDIFEQLTEKIIKEQEAIIGPVALEQARKVPGLEVDWSQHKVLLKGSKTEVVNQLIKQYETLFGRASIEVCRHAAKDLTSKIPPNELPQLLQ